MIEISRAQADYNFYLQILMGDAVDGYKGCPGIGKVKGAKLLEAAAFVDDLTDGTTVTGFSESRAWMIIVNAYAQKGLGMEVIMMNARMARILRAEDYDVRTRQVKLWEPPV